MSFAPPLTLSTGSLELKLSPSIGGSISSLEWTGSGGRAAVLRKCNSCPENVLEAASFPLVPYVNRIRGGRFDFRGREVALAVNMAGDPSPLHGQGWLAPWEVDSAAASQAVLSFHHRPGEWPWEYCAEQCFELDEAGLSLRLTCRNLSDEPMPCGLGQHPYFQCGPATRIDTRVTHVWTIDEQVLPVGKIAAAGRFDLADRPVCGQDLDHGFGGWGGTARMTDPGWPFDLELSSPDARFFQLYSPASGGIFVAEPVSHANAALNAPEEQWDELGMRVLDPGEDMSLDMRLEVNPK
ncbi:aldose 1-epimerase [Sphingomonas sp.]|uniref:aldose 1-epimerase n=1 Tax=Sphingomonas sp. TaxID=28214 RepID=UPI0017D9312A|nr:aldose 1-epimerase [Sphingomonas sp.]MBA3511218.1 aldose 1-epimerase [Sphingomonas sp.]